MQFDNFVNTFFDVCEARKNSAGEIAQKRMAIKNHLSPYFGPIDLAAIGKPEIRRYIKSKQCEGYAEKTINNHLLVMSRFLNVARDERVLAGPGFKIETIPLQHSESRYLTPAECRRVIAAAQFESPTIAAMVTLALHTGLRVGELLALTWANVDLKARKIAVRKSLCRVSGNLKAPKNGKSRDVFLNDDAARVIGKLAVDAGPLFDISYSAAYDAICRIEDASGVSDLGWHTLRHTFASLLVLEGVPLFTVGRLLGHSSIRITERYAHLTADKNKDAVAALAVAMGA